MSKVLCVADHSQLEPRLMAHFSQDPAMLAVYAPGGVGDIYLDMASGVFGTPHIEVSKSQRGVSKVLVLGMGYGAQGSRIGSILTVNGYPTTAEVGAGYLDALEEHYPVFFAWREEVIARVHRTGYVETLGGRHRRLKAQFVDRRNWKNIKYGERQAVNAIIQGSAADIVRHNMVSIGHDTLLRHFALLAQVHDELIWEVEESLVTPEDLELIKWHGEVGHGYDLRVPLGFDPQLGVSWHEAKEGSPLLDVPDELVLNDESLDYEEAH